MKENKMKARLRDGRPSAGCFVNVPSPHIVELIGWIGFDFVVLDCEHGIMDYQTAEHMIRAAELSDITPVVRVGLNMQQHIQRFMDAGAAGVMIPFIDSCETAKSVVDSVKYPPVGKRGLAINRASGYGQAHTPGDYVKLANRETFICLQIENQEGIDNAQDIVATEHADVIFLGPNDLSSMMGIHGQMQDPRVTNAIESLGSQALEAGKQVGTVAADPEAFRRWSSLGFNWLIANATWFLSAQAKSYMGEIKELRQG